MSDDTLFEEEFDVQDQNNGPYDPNDDIFSPVPSDPLPKKALRPKQITISLDVASVLKELFYHFELPDLERISRALTDVIPIYGKLGLLESNPPPWKEQAETKAKPKVHVPKPVRDLPYRFTEEEISNFVRLADEGVSFEEIARNSGRSVLGVKRAVLRHRERSAASSE